MLNRNTDNHATHVGVLEITMLYINDLPGCVQNAKLVNAWFMLSKNISSEHNKY